MVDVWVWVWCVGMELGVEDNEQERGKVAASLDSVALGFKMLLCWRLLGRRRPICRLIPLVAPPVTGGGGTSTFWGNLGKCLRMV